MFDGRSPAGGLVWQTTYHPSPSAMAFLFLRGEQVFEQKRVPIEAVVPC